MAISNRVHAEPTYHLWLKPPGQSYDVLAEAIRQLSHKLQAPIFEPHVTLLSPLDGSEQEHRVRTRQLAQQLQSLSLTLPGASYRDTYFQCVFMKVQETPAVLAAHESAKTVFAHTKETAFMPHLSLVYGLFPVEIKQEIIKSLPPHLHMTFDATSLYLIKANSENPKDWHEILTVPMGESCGQRSL